MIEGENKENKGERKYCLSPTTTTTTTTQQQALSCQAPKNIPSEIFSKAPTIAKVA